MSVGIVHLGVGGFHRSHQAMYVDRLLSHQDARPWGLCGVGVLPQDARMRDVLLAQDGLYTLIVRHPDGSSEPRVIGSIVEYLLAPDDPAAVVERIAAPSTRMVTMTVTEGGYHVNPTSGELDLDDPTLRADLRPGASARTAFGLLLHGLSRRRAHGRPGLAVVSCDNIAGNGHLAERVVRALAQQYEQGLREWVEAEVTFPSSMVDRITPVTTDQDRIELEQQFGLRDGWPVVCEPFHQWVLEDRFPHGRPPLERAGVQLVHDVGPYELMKLRLLNASHQALAHLGRLAGYRLVHEAAADAVFARFLRGWMEQEARSTLLPVPGIDLDQYMTTLLERFANPEMQDTVARLSVDASDRVPTFVVPVVRERLAAGATADRGALVLAAWARCLQGVDDAGARIENVDRQDRQLSEAAARSGEDPLAFLRQRDLFGDLADHDGFAHSYLEALRGLQARGARVMARERA